MPRMYKTTEEKMNWVRSNWKGLKLRGLLEKAVAKIIKEDEFLSKNYSVQDIIDIEESLLVAPVVNTAPAVVDKYPDNPF